MTVVGSSRAVLTLGLAALLACGGGDDSTTDDAGADGRADVTAQDVAAEDVAAHDATPPDALADAASPTFDIYIAPRAGTDTNPDGVAAGDDSNAGTLDAPWAITSLKTTSANWSKLAGERIGLLPGTYNVGAMMVSDPISGAIQIPGGTSVASTYLGSSDASGHYAPRAATLNAFANGLYGGFHSTGPGVYDGPILSHSGMWPAPYPTGYLVIDGIVFTGYSYKALRIGGHSSGDGPIIKGPVTVQNCEFTGQGFNAGDGQDNGNSIWIDPFQPTGSQGALVTNCWFHDNAWEGGTTSADHLNAIIVFGFSTECYGVEISYNTSVNSGSIYGKEGGVDGVDIHHNYVDASMYTAIGSGAISDFMSGGGAFSGLMHASSIDHNVCLVHGNTPGGSALLTFPTLGQTPFGSSYGWQTPVAIYNNTLISISGSAGPMAFDAAAAQDESGLGQLEVYNNIYVNEGSGGSWNNYGNFLTTSKSPKIWDYNLFPTSGVQWSIVPDANNRSLCASHTLYTTAAAFSNAIAAGGGISGAESHSLAGVPVFTGAGAYAARYQLASGSAGRGAGTTTGTSGGAACDMGAWGGATVPARIGCDFAK